jgi:2-polyprenyl-6-methoxyphenol hydroxylase-like FAD-dependent oxidoreductase
MHDIKDLIPGMKQDTYDVAESWAFPGKTSDMLKACEGWDETLRAVIRRIPENILIDYKLLWRDPVTKWVSDGGRVVIAGDAAHPHLATSGQGAAQAIEDGATLGVVLSRGGKSHVPTALKVFERLRYALQPSSQLFIFFCLS